MPRRHRGDRGLSRTTTNPITRGQYQQSPRPLPNGGPLAHRHRSADHLPDSDLDSPPPVVRRSHLAGHKSVPDLNTVYYDNRDSESYKFQQNPDPVTDLGPGFKSVDNLYNANQQPSVNLARPNNAALNYKSVDNLAEGNLTSRRLHGFKSVGHLPSASLSDSDEQDMSYKPKVGNIIKKFNKEAEETPRRQSVEIPPVVEMDHRGTLEPDRYRNHNNNNNQPHKSPGVSPVRQTPSQKQQATPRNQSYRQPMNQSFSKQRDQRSQTNIHNNLTSATLVRQVNHGFGRMDRSPPSPPPRTCLGLTPASPECSAFAIRYVRLGG